MTPRVATAMAALHEIGEHRLAFGISTRHMEPDTIESFDLVDPDSAAVIRKAGLVASIAHFGPMRPDLCFRHGVIWKAGGSRPPEWGQCAKVAAWQMLHDPTTVCANAPRPI